MLLIVLFGATGAFANASQVDRYLSDLETLYARFEQRLYDEQGDLIEISNGQFYLQRPNRMRWEYATPYHQQIVSDGKKVWVYDVDLEQVIVRSLTSSLGHTPAAIFLSERPLSESFVLYEQPKTQGLERIDLIPRREEAGFAVIRLAFDGQQLRQMELVDRIGQLTRLQFTSINRNLVLDAALFVFVPPLEVDVFTDGDNLASQ